MKKRAIFGAALLLLSGCKTDGSSPPPPASTTDNTVANSTDNSVVVVTPPPPPAAVTQTCPDGSVIPATSTCPVPPPPPPPTPVGCPSLTNPAWAAYGAIKLSDTICVATQTCDSLMKTPTSTGTFPTVTAGLRYYVSPRTDGITLPAGVTGPAVVAAPVDGTDPTTMDQVYSITCFQ